MRFKPFKNSDLSDEGPRRAYSLSYVYRGLKRRYNLTTAGRITLGRSPDRDISLFHSDVADLQCSFERTTDGELLLFSESDQVPTLVNGYPISFVKLSPGDTIELGSINLKVSRFHALRPTDAAPILSVSYETNFGRAALQSLKRSHWTAISMLFHLLLILWLFNMEMLNPGEGAAVGIIQSPLTDLFPPVELSESVDLPTPEQMLEDLTPPEPVDSDPLQEQMNLLSDSNSDQEMEDPLDAPLGTELGGLPAGGLSGMGLGGGGGGVGKSGGKAWREHVGILRGKGMDVAILFDSTGSMQGFILEVKATIKEMVEVLDLIVSDIRISLVTYKGDPFSSAYVVAHTPLVDDSFELFNFMRSVDISGGSAEGYAAINKALKTATEKLIWREGTEKAIVVIGDAAAFPGERRNCLELARKFDGKVGAIYKPSRGVTLLMEPETKAFFQALTTAGGGPFLRDAEDDNVVRRIVSAVVGTKWRQNVENVFEQRESPRWTRVIQRKQEEADYNWFFRQFRKRRIRYELVDTLLEMNGEQVSREMWSCLVSDKRTPWLTQRAVFVLQVLTGLQIDYIRSNRERLSRSQMLYISEYLRFLYGPQILAEREKPR